MPSDSVRPLSLKGSLILADPSLRDAHFRKSVLLLTEHHRDKGAHGYVLNQPYGKTVGEVLSGDDFSALSDVPIFVGGPVSREHLIFASLQWKVATKRLTCQTHLSVGDAIARRENGETIRAFLGYSGWGKGQLERELQENAWIARTPGPNVLEGSAKDGLWRQLMASLGPYYELRTFGPSHPLLN
jgi:putative transcriptional regulator